MSNEKQSNNNRPPEKWVEKHSAPTQRPIAQPPKQQQTPQNSGGSGGKSSK